MEYLKYFKIDIWWKAVLVLGILCAASALLFNIDIINRQHLFGLGLGLILVGIAEFMAFGYIHQQYLNNILIIPTRNHSITSIVLLIVGVVFSLIFLALIFKSLL